MKSSFFEFNVAISGLFTARGGLDTVSHNTANASTPGYSRQYVEQRATTPLTFYNGKGMFGTGSEIYGVAQMRSFYLDKKYWAEVSVLGEYSTKNTLMDTTQRVFNELSGTGFVANFNDFFDRLQDLSTTANDTTYRTNVLQLAQSMATFFKTSYETLQAQQRDINGEVLATVSVINSIGTEIQALNRQIVTMELDGSAANDLRDQRALLVDQLSKYVNVTVKEVERNEEYAAGMYPKPEDRSRSQKEFIVQINNQDFVKGFELNSLECRQRVVEPGNPSIFRNPEDTTGLYDIYWARIGSKFDVYSPTLTGELKGLIDARDGNNGNYAKSVNAGSYNPATREFTVQLDTAGYRIDLNPSGGYLSLKKTSYLSMAEITYESVEVDANGLAVFKLPASTKATAADFAALDYVTVGQTSSYKGVPYYLSRIDNMVRTFALALNEGKYMNGGSIQNVNGHVNGFGVGEFDELTNKLLFTYRAQDTNGDYVDAVYSGSAADNNGINPVFDISKLSARNIKVNGEITSNPLMLACSDKSTSGESNNNIILQFINIKSDQSLFLEGTLTDYVIGMTGELAIDVQQAQRFEKNYTDVTTTINNQRISVSGVDINEEMTNMIKYQQQYQACARLVNVIDGIYNTLINNLGHF